MPEVVYTTAYVKEEEENHEQRRSEKTTMKDRKGKRIRNDNYTEDPERLRCQKEKKKTAKYRVLEEKA